MDHHGADAHFTAGTLNAQRDLAAVGDQDLFEHQPRMKSGWPYSTGWPFSTRIAFTSPEASASISFMSFIASMMQMVSPSFTACPTSTNALASGDGVR